MARILETANLGECEHIHSTPLQACSHPRLSYTFLLCNIALQVIQDQCLVEKARLNI
jgi:hypothetical protein